MGSLVRIIIGVVLIIASIWWIVMGSDVISGFKGSATLTSRPALADLVTVLNGSIPLLFILLGLLMVWLEWDTMSTQRKVSKEENQ